MHGKQIVEWLDLPNREPTGQQAGHVEGEVAPFPCFKCKKDCWDCSSLVFDPIFFQFYAAFPDWLLASVQLDLFTLSPCSLARGTQAGLGTTALATRWGVGNHNHPFLLPGKTILRGIFWLLWLPWSCWELPGWSSPRAVVGFCIPSFSGVSPACPEPPQCCLPWELCCRALIWPEGMSRPCCPPACAGHQALLAAMPWWHSQVPDKNLCWDNLLLSAGVWREQVSLPLMTQGKSF